MPSEKEIMLAVILKYLFGDDLCKITVEVSEFKTEFTRPLSQSLYNRFLITWTASGEFKIFGLVGHEKPVPIAANDWFKVGSYLKNNYIKARQHLKITAI